MPFFAHCKNAQKKVPSHRQRGIGSCLVGAIVKSRVHHPLQLGTRQRIDIDAALAHLIDQSRITHRLRERLAQHT